MDISFDNKLAPAKGRILISEPFLNDPYFKRTTVLLVEHNDEGSLGFILNRKIEVSLSEAIKGFPEFSGPLCFGGPVCRDQLFYIHKLGDTISGSLKVTNDLYWGGDFDQLKGLIKEEKVSTDQVRFFVGYSGWNPGQLAEEIEQKSWIVSEGETPLILGENTEHLWTQLLKSLGKHYTVMANFPEDPSLN